MAAARVAEIERHGYARVGLPFVTGVCRVAVLSDLRAVVYAIAVGVTSIGNAIVFFVQSAGIRPPFAFLPISKAVAVEVCSDVVVWIAVGGVVHRRVKPRTPVKILPSIVHAIAVGIRVVQCRSKRDLQRI